MRALEVKQISKNLGGLEVLKDVSISVEIGERRAIIGPNGAGKTTLFNVISGVYKPNQGKIYILGKNVTDLALYRRSRLGLARTFQRNTLFFNLTLTDNINLARNYNPSKISTDSLLKNWHLWEKRKTLVKELSYGEQRQVELLMALVQSPKVILLDEPTAGMSQRETTIITEMIKSLPQDITILIIEHDMDVVFNLAEKITVLHQGKVLCEGSKYSIKADPRVKEVYLGSYGDEVKG